MIFRRIFDEMMLHGEAYSNLHDLCKNIGHRLSGSPQAAMAVQWGYARLQSYGFDSVWLQPCMVPHWERGEKEFGEVEGSNGMQEAMDVMALGGSIATPDSGILGSIVEVSDFDALKKLGADKIKGKIVFFNHIFPQNVINSFDGYGEAGPYRWYGPSEASKLGAVAVIIRSVSSADDNFPHTGSTGFAPGVTKIPCAALSPRGADRLDEILRQDPAAKFKMVLHCKWLDDVPSFNVMAEIKGSEFPGQVVVVGGHLDSWDVGEGAQDDGAGVVQSMEVLCTLKALGIRPKRTIRCVFFMNEENGQRGAQAFADFEKGNLHEKCIAAIESDEGGYSPRGFTIDSAFLQNTHIDALKKLMLPYGVYDFTPGFGGTDVDPLQNAGAQIFGLHPDSQRYMDLHHSNNDIFENVDRRELEMGASALAMFAWWLSEYGVQSAR